MNQLPVEKRLLDNSGNAIYRVETRSGTQTFTVPERRRLDAVTEFDFEERDGEPDALVFRGHSAVFDRRSDDLGGFTEIMARGAFRKALDRTPDVRALFNHNENYVLARTKNNTLELREDPRGLHSYFTAAPTSYAKDLRTLVKRGDIDQQSFAFTVERDKWEEDDNGMITRTVTEVRDLFDVSIVTFPAYPQTDVSARTAEPEAETELGNLAVDEAEDEATETREVLLRELQQEAARGLTLAITSTASKGIHIGSQGASRQRP
jgi:HK97 family phage prohead protease